MRVKNILILVSLILIVFLSGFFARKMAENRSFRLKEDSIATLQNDKKLESLSKIKVGNKNLLVEIASTSAQKAKGLSNRENLPENTGLFFTYEQPKYVTFWMKDMLFPIDIIWIRDNEIIGIEENVPVPKAGTLNLPRYRPAKPVDYVLETNAGWCRKNNVKVGSKIAF